MNREQLTTLATEFLSTHSFSSYSDIDNRKPFTLKSNVASDRLTTFGTGGEISTLFEFSNSNSLIDFIIFCKNKSVNFRILGNGSNVVIPDVGINDYFVVKYNSNTGYQLDEVSDSLVRVYVDSSYPLMTLSRELTNLGFSGMEFAAGIPGTVGGAIKMNAGAHGSSISNIVDNVEIVSLKGDILKLDNSELEFSYRKSSISQDIVIKACLHLKKEDTEVIKLRRSEALAYRKKTQPLSYPSAGSVFRNPSQEISAGSILEQSGFKGRSKGGVAYSELHANWIIRKERQSLSSDIYYLVNMAKDEILRSYDILLKEEIIFW